MMNHKRFGPVAQRFAERRLQEDEAPRLAAQVPSLVTLRLEIQECAGLLDIRHVRHIVVGRAPAVFLVRCSDEQCHDGVHDLTMDVMNGLRSRRTTFKGDDDCNGSIGSLQSPCRRVLHFDAVATYAVA